MTCVLGISGSILSANPCFLGKTIRALEDAQIDSVHFDIMDGNFVPEISWGTCLLGASRALTTLPFDVHLMVNNPQKYVYQCADAKVSQVAFHPSACDSPLEMIQLIQSLKMKACIVVSPHENPIDWPFWKNADAGLIMTVNPGKGGQAFLSSPLCWILRIKALYPHLYFGVDGGINLDTSITALQAGADYLVCGSFLMNSTCMTNSIDRLKQQQRAFHSKSAF